MGLSLHPATHEMSLGSRYVGKGHGEPGPNQGTIAINIIYFVQPLLTNIHTAVGPSKMGVGAGRLAFGRAPKKCGHIHSRTHTHEDGLTAAVFGRPSVGGGAWGPFLPQLRTLGHGAHEQEMAAVKPRAAVEPGRSPLLTSGLLACPMEAVERAGLW